MANKPLCVTLSDDEASVVASHAAKLSMSPEQIVHMALKLYDALESMSESRHRDRNKVKCCKTCTCTPEKK